MNLMEYTWQEPHCGGVLFVCLFVQKFAGANKLQQSGNRSMSYLAGKAERCVVSLLSSSWNVCTPLPQSHGQSLAIVLYCCGSFSICLVEEVSSQTDISLKEKKKEKKPQQFRINAIKDKSGWKVWNAEVKVCVKGCGSCFLWSEIGGSAENHLPSLGGITVLPHRNILVLNRYLMFSLQDLILVCYWVIKEQHYLRVALEGEEFCLPQDPFLIESV